MFGTGKLNELHAQEMPGKKAMVVISNGKSMKETGTLYRVLKELAQAGVETAVFDRVQANPLRSTVMDGAAFAKEDCCDFVVALGGYDCLFPVLSVVDPELMISVPPKFTAYQGFDALFHSTECYISKAQTLWEICWYSFRKIAACMI